MTDVRFLHLNHTNPLYDPHSKQANPYEMGWAGKEGIRSRLNNLRCLRAPHIELMRSSAVDWGETGFMAQEHYQSQAKDILGVKFDTGTLNVRSMVNISQSMSLFECSGVDTGYRSEIKADSENIDVSAITHFIRVS